MELPQTPHVILTITVPREAEAEAGAVPLAEAEAEASHPPPLEEEAVDIIATATLVPALKAGHVTTDPPAEINPTEVMVPIMSTTPPQPNQEAEAEAEETPPQEARTLI